MILNEYEYYPAKPLKVTKEGLKPHVIQMDGSPYIVPEFVFTAVKLLIRDYDRHSKRKSKNAPS